jgi:hypothetical protein
MPCGDIFNVGTTFGIATPSGCVVEESNQEDTVELDEVRGGNGEIARVCPKTYGVRTASIRGRGDMPHATLVAGGITLGSSFVTSRIRREKNTGEPSFEINSKAYFNVNEPDPGP